MLAERARVGGSEPTVKLDEVVRRVQRFARRWPAVGASAADVALADGDSDGGFERLLRSALEGESEIGEISRQRELHFGDGRLGAIVPNHELDVLVGLDPGVFVLEAKAWKDEVDKEPIIIFLAKLLDFLASPRFDTFAETVHSGFIGLSGFTEAARRVMFSFGVIPFSKNGEDLSFRFLDLCLGDLQRIFAERGLDVQAEHAASSRSLLTPYLAFENRQLTELVRFERDYATVDLVALRRGAEVYDEARDAHSNALLAYRRLTAALES